jgi:hypothetical protein
MTTTFTELKEKLLRLDEVTLLELLEINAEDLINRFEDIIEDKYDQLVEAVED